MSPLIISCSCRLLKVIQIKKSRKSKLNTEGGNLFCAKYSVAIKVTVLIVAINSTAKSSYRQVFFGSVLKGTDFTTIIHHAKKTPCITLTFIVELSLF